MSLVVPAEGGDDPLAQAAATLGRVAASSAPIEGASVRSVTLPFDCDGAAVTSGGEADEGCAARDGECEADGAGRCQ